MNKRKQLGVFQPDRTTQQWAIRSEAWEKLSGNYYFLMCAYQNSVVELSCAEKVGKLSHNYWYIAHALKMEKGHFCNLAEKCGCLKRGDIIYSDKKENIEALIEALLPWAMATRLMDNN